MNTKALMLTLEDPWHRRYGGALRTRAMSAYLTDAGYDVEMAFPTAPASQVLTSDRPGVRRVAALKRRLLPMPTSLGARDIDLRQRVARSQADLLHVSALSQAPYRGRTTARLWLDFMDLWSSFALREASSRTGVAALTTRSQAAWLARREVSACQDAWIVTAAGWADTETLTSRGVPAVWLPVTLPDEEFTLVRRTSGPGQVAGFLGNFNYWPNRDAYDTFIEHWLPALTRKGWSVLVAGMGSESLPPPPMGADLVGPVEDVDDFYAQIDASLAPIALGGGIKVKVIESLAKGVPVIGTRFAFDGFPTSFHHLFAHVDLLRPDFTGLDSLGRGNPSADALRVFRQSDASRRVAELLTARPSDA